LTAGVKACCRHKYCKETANKIRKYVQILKNKNINKSELTRITF
jgi:hypothetical protein